MAPKRQTTLKQSFAMAATRGRGRGSVTPAVTAPRGGRGGLGRGIPHHPPPAEESEDSTSESEQEEENPLAIVSQQDATAELAQVIDSHTTVPRTRRPRQAKRMVRNYLMNSLLRMDRHHAAFGPLSLTELRLPRLNGDPGGNGRRLTWQSFIETISNKLENIPAHIDDCWFVSAKSQKDYATHNLAPSGKDINPRKKSNKFGVHRILTVLEFPDEYDKINTHEKQKTGDSWVCAHRCSKGTHEGKTCINPRHIVVCTQQINQSHKGCVNGCAFLCPHDPKCLFTDSNGYYLPCRNREDKLPEVCHHHVQCLTHAARITRSTSARIH